MAATLNVGVARLTQGVSVDAVAMQNIRISAGDSLRLRLDYEIEEHSKQENLWRVLLHVSRGGAPETVVAEHRDRFLRDDARKDSLQWEGTFAQGEHKIAFEAQAQIHTTPWVDDTAPGDVEEAAAKGEILVTAA